MSRLAAFIFTICWLTAASAEVILGRVTAITDGDTITLQVDSGQPRVVRITGIDAPERNQPFGQQASAHLRSLVLNKPATVDTHKTDRFGRLVGKLTVDGADVGLAQIRAGLAWHYKAYASEQSEQDQAAYEAAELEARRAGRGLWSERAPMPPWEWRARER